MGLLDWLTEGVGSDMGGSSMGSGMQMPPGMPPVQMTGQDAPPVQPQTPPTNNPNAPFVAATNLYSGPGGGPQGMTPPLPPGGDPMTAGGAPPNGPGLPPPPPAGPLPPSAVPMPTPRPPGADAGPAALPPNAAPTGGTGMPPGPPTSLAPPSAPSFTPGPNAGLNDSGSALGRALGLDANKERGFFGSIGAGLTAAGNSKGKGKGQALFSGAGAAIEGGQKAEDKSYDQRLKSLQLAITAQAQGDKAAYNKNYAQYLGAKLKNDTDKVASGGKSGAWNKPDSQKFIDAQNALAKDRDIVASQKLLEQAAKDGSAETVAKAKADHTALVQQKQQMYLAGVGLNAQTIAANIKTPPGTPPTKGPDGKLVGGNPHIVNTQQDFDTYVKPGQAYKNPRDGEIYIRKGGKAEGGADAGAAAPPSAPVPPGPMPGSNEGVDQFADTEETGY